MTALRLLPPLGWTALIAWLSTPAWSGEHTAAVFFPVLHWLFPGAGAGEIAAGHWLLRKAAHLTEYAVLGGLWHWALRPRGRGTALWGALGLAALTAALDEVHQATTALRGGSRADVGLDVAGALAAVTAGHVGVRGLADAAASALLWIAAAGGTALLAVHASIEAPSGWLWWSTPLAWLALGVRWLLRRRA